MESTSKFNLEKSLAQWKNGLYQDDSLTEDTIAELESHLLDETDELRAKGLDEEEAFFVARKRLGDTGVLIKEFEKLDDNVLSFNRIRFFTIGIIFSWFLNHFISVISSVSAIIGFKIFHNFDNVKGTVSTTIIGICLIFLILYGLILMKKVKSLGIFGNIPFLLTLISSSIGFRIAFLKGFGRQSALNESILGSARVANTYFFYAILIFIVIAGIFIHIKAKKRKALAN